MPERTLIFSLSIALLAALPARAQELDGRAIAERADKQNRAKDEVDRVTMLIFDKSGEKRTRELTTWFLAGEGGEDRSLVRFDAPADVKGTGLLTLQHAEKDEQWLYLPELRKTKRIAGSSRALSFAGTDFSNFDMRTEDLAHHDYKRLDDAQANGRACYVIEAVPKNDDVKEETGYSKRTLWIDKERFTVQRCEYYDKDGKLLKRLVLEGEKQVQGLWRPVQVTMENVQEGSKTVVQHDRGREINKGIEESKFTKRALERP